MSWRPSVLVTLVAVATAATLGAASGNIANLPQPIIHALTPIDTMPSTKQIEAVHGSAQEAVVNLQAIARSPSAGEDVVGGVDVGIRLRAIRALTLYCADPCASHEVHATLLDLATDPLYRDALRGNDLLVHRATLEAIGVLRVADDIAVLVPALDHPSRDIRAAAAHALRDLGNPAALTPLRTRYQAEQVDQVRIAISDALRVLGQPLP